MRYITCTITLTEDTLTYHEEDERVFEKDVAFVRDRLAELTVQRLSYWIQNNLAQSQQKQLTSVKDLKAIGLHLHRLLFFDRSIREAFEKKHNELNERRRNEPDLRLRLELVFDTTTEALAALPWEFLYVSSKEDMDKGVFFAGERTELLLTRRLGTIKPEAFQPADELRILMVTCQPKVLGAIDSKEINGVVTSIEELKSVAGSGVRIAKLENPTYAQLRKAIDGDWKQDDAIFGAPDILHFIGHGKEGSLALMMSSDEADYDDTSNEEQFRWAEADQVRKLFTKHRPRLVFLHACKGAASTSVESFNSTARELVYEGIAAVVAMQYNISNTDAGLFARKFYEELGKGTDIDESVKIGRLALGEIYPAWAHPRFGTPVVYVQAYDPLVKARQPAGSPTGAADTASNARPAPRQELKGQATAAPAPTSAPATTQRDELIVGTTIKLDN